MSSTCLCQVRTLETIVAWTANAVQDLKLRPDPARIKQVLLALDHPASRYADLPEADRNRLKGEVLLYAKQHGVRLPKPPAARRTALVREPASMPALPASIADLFDQARWPRHPYCTDDLGEGCYIRSLTVALKRAYVQANPPHLRVWSIHDIDRAGAANAWETAGLPPPSWMTVNRENGHAHAVYGLRAPVLVDSPDMRQAPMRYLCAVESAFREALDADAGFAGLLTKNPAHPLWHLLRGPRLQYDLAELAEFVDLRRHSPKKKPEEVGLGRNVTLFDALRHWAYRHVRHYKGEVKNFVAWQSACNARALVRNGDFQTPLDGREVWHIAKSVAKWTWNRFDLDASDAKFAALQAHRGRASGEARLAASEDKRASARLMAAQGINKSEIARKLDVTRQTVINWLAEPEQPSALRT